MEYQDKTVTCIDCKKDFVFTAGEQQFYERKGFRESPKRCKTCREERKNRRPEEGAARPPREGAAEGKARSGPPEGRPQRELFEATCVACGSPARVPFRPQEGRPVYCRDCYAGRSQGGNY